GETDDGEIAELLDGVDAGFNVLDFGDGEGGVFVAHSRRALADVDEAVFVAIDERVVKGAGHGGENGGGSAAAARGRGERNGRQSLRAPERMECNSQIAKKGHVSPPLCQ